MKKDKITMTMLTITTGFLAVGLIFKWEAAVYLSLATGVIGIVSPFLSRWITWTWDQIGFLLGLIIPRIILALIFYLFLFPVAMMARLFRKDPLFLSKGYKSLFIERNFEATPQDFEKTW